MCITIRLDKDDQDILRGIVEAKNTNMSAYIREIILEKIDEEIDRKMYKKAVKVMEDDDSEFVSWEEAKAELDKSGKV